MASKHPNVYMDISAHLPKYLEPVIVQFMNTRGKNKVLFGTNAFGLSRCKDQLMEMNVKDETKQKVLRDNALRIFNL
jgi:predicted TIM-barrel fold metal-dependent hydrolase